jgi:hypothetical protein
MYTAYEQVFLPSTSTCSITSYENIIFHTCPLAQEQIECLKRRLRVIYSQTHSTHNKQP